MANVVIISAEWIFFNVLRFSVTDMLTVIAEIVRQALDKNDEFHVVAIDITKVLSGFAC